MANNGGIAITDKSKLTVTKLATNLDDIGTDLQTTLRGATFANGDVIYQFLVEKNKNDNQCIVYIVWEDQ
jgi:hypothetical protein